MKLSERLKKRIGMHQSIGMHKSIEMQKSKVAYNCI